MSSRRPDPPETRGLGGCSRSLVRGGNTMQDPQRACSADRVCGRNMQSLSSKELPDNSCSVSVNHTDHHDTDSCSSSVNYAYENSHSHNGDDDSTLDSEETQDGATDDPDQDNETMGFWLSWASLQSSVSGLTIASPLTLEASSSSLNASMLWGSKSSCDSSQTSIDRVSRGPRRWTLDSSHDFDIKNRDLMTTDHDIEMDRRHD